MDIEKILDAKLQELKSEMKSNLDEIKELIQSGKRTGDESKLMDVCEVSQYLNVTCKSVRRY